MTEAQPDDKTPDPSTESNQAPTGGSPGHAPPTADL